MIEPKTGEILALISAPSYDPGLLVDVNALGTLIGCGTILFLVHYSIAHYKESIRQAQHSKC